jgi:hypothetical protein
MGIEMPKKKLRGAANDAHPFMEKSLYFGHFFLSKTPNNNANGLPKDSNTYNVQ